MADKFLISGPAKKYLPPPYINVAWNAGFKKMPKKQPTHWRKKCPLKIFAPPINTEHFLFRDEKQY